MMVSDSFYCTLWMLSLFGQYLGEDLQFSGPVYGAVGGSVVFAPVNPPSTSINIVQWHFGSTLILTGSPDSPTIFPAYRDRVSFDINTFALELWNLILGDSGIYRLTVITSVGAQLTGETSLQVFENITNVRVTGPEGSLIEGESSANFSSEGTGIITSVQWMKDNLPLSPSNSIIFSSDNRSVSISPVQRSDSGEYQCTYRNPASSETAKPVRLIINYGPEDVSVKGEDVVDLGVHVSLSCSANSEPAASFSWKFNETDTNVTTDTFTINKTDFTHSGDYICTASNNVTKRNASHKHALLVKERGGGLSSGAIAGIVIGVLVAVAGICGLTVYLTKTKQIPKLNQQQKGQASEAAQSRQETVSNPPPVRR
ncbi:carcinoembryonic antigen-related cell adhesion molecule 20-like isoform X32 [Carassius gibelio]|uniref:carcinoembryonic antigen-related cell adhesion molecule 20-like isoform X28 n=1 Tax=Carassius gibelio TaxID=101364 RepID=UPI0022793BC5|nr:carcinoembryonic antigen-related cell adhesion molecule 20-like isoform X28 [Carassius gibelio]XP_052474639.1 carcinoembryonic antigen-related cell adhesion molecule 20-like isoform X29 [Carassius gibelio]XP_052474640.1 carcinoembryonic antigen-related cell adhesion molecule 20-like isoform X30 [Carassius gibelio]XP_052474641.1 carcinoembryonic antigen-related cell adhesion molecule 20-like isoform X31 [Carassius gibelio]XP_052474642.1 carcinoembryonic antigen-related cell adhesion molecule 